METSWTGLILVISIASLKRSACQIFSDKLTTNMFSYFDINTKYILTIKSGVVSNESILIFFMQFLYRGVY